MRLKKLLSVRPIVGKLRGSFIKDLFYGFCLSLKWSKDKNQAGRKKSSMGFFAPEGWLSRRKRKRPGREGGQGNFLTEPVRSDSIPQVNKEELSLTRPAC